MSLLAIAWTIVAFLVGALVVVLCVVMANLFRVLTSTKDLIDGVTTQTVPLLGEVNTTVAMVNQELVRVDGILATVEGVTTSAGGGDGAAGSIGLAAAAGDRAAPLSIFASCSLMRVSCSSARLISS